MQEQPVQIPTRRHPLEGDLHLSPDALGLALFAHGSGSSRHSPRNRLVARALQAGRLATLLIDLLTPEEERIDALTAELRFDIPFLAQRLLDVVAWIRQRDALAALPLGLFGSSTGAAAALVAAATLGGRVEAVVSRGGRPDLASDALPRVTAPTLLIVGARDTEVLRLNRQALAQLECPKELAIVPEATHLFAEPGTLEQVAALARAWLVAHLARPAHAHSGSGSW